MPLSHDRLTALTRAAVAVTAAAMPAYLVRFTVGPIPTTLLEIAILATIAVYVATLVVRRGPLPGRTALDIPIALFLIAGAIGVFVAPDHRAALGIYRAYLIEPVAIFYIAVAVFDTERLGYLLLAVAAVTVAFCVADGVYFYQAYARNHLVPGHIAAAFSLNPNYVAMYLEPLIAVAMGFLFFGAGRQRLVAAVVLVFVLPAEVATFSRGGLVALGLLALIAVISIRNVVIRVSVLAASALAAIIVWNLPLLGHRIRQSLSPSSGALFTRERIWVQTSLMLRDHPIFGAGISGYQTVMAPYRATDPKSVVEPYPHNIALTTYSELGLLGLIAFAWILGVLIVRPWLALRRATGIDRALLWGTGTAFAMLLVHGLVDSPYWKNDLSVEFWLLAAVQTLAVRHTRSRPTPQTGVSPDYHPFSTPENGR